MMETPETTVGAFEAKVRFMQLLEHVAAGEEITITRHGHPVARLVPALPALLLRKTQGIHSQNAGVGKS
jgi:prevent-host-death family protein